MIPTHLRERRLALYAAMIVCGLAAGGALAFWQMTHGKEPDTGACKGESSTRLAAASQGDVAAFIALKPRAMPDIVFLDSAGASRRLADFKGRTVLLNLWATWCVPCRVEMPALNALQKKLTGKDFAVVALSLDAEPETAKAFYAAHAIDALPLFTDAQGSSFQALRQNGLGAGLPTSLLIDAKGCLLGHLSGPADWAGEDARRLIDAAMDVN